MSLIKKLTVQDQSLIDVLEILNKLKGYTVNFSYKRIQNYSISFRIGSSSNLQLISTSQTPLEWSIEKNGIQIKESSIEDCGNLNEYSYISYNTAESYFSQEKIDRFRLIFDMNGIKYAINMDSKLELLQS